jgi:hypothetical protein
MSKLPTREEWLKNSREQTPDPDFDGLSNPRDISLEDLYGVGTELTVRLQKSLNDDTTENSLTVSLDLEVAEHIKVASDRPSQIVVAVITSHNKIDIAPEAGLLVIKFFDPVYVPQ